MKNLHNALQLKQLYILKQLGFDYTDVTPSELEEDVAELPDSIISLADTISNCHLCQLSKSRQQVIFGEGNEDADIMFIGEEPGATEDSTGRPFVGRAGEILTKIIENVLYMSRSQTYITNIVKCKPPSNRTCTTAEALTCRPYILKQIDLVKPKIIVTLGEMAYRYLTNDESPFANARGTVIKNDKYTLVPTLHPSYLLRNPSAKKDVMKDMLKAKEILAE